MSELRTFNCVADLEFYIEESKFDLYPGIIGKWARSEALIYIVGIFVPKGHWQSMFPRQCVRWKSTANQGRGLFGKGIAGYLGKSINPDRLKNLKIVK
ncbi:MAG: hypothetical protein Q8P20_01140 [bacterium]|nr:hypothetical protein [bacterium]